MTPARKARQASGQVKHVSNTSSQFTCAITKLAIYLRMLVHHLADTEKIVRQSSIAMTKQ